MKVSEATFEAWSKWIDVTRSRCHLHFELEGGDIPDHISICNKSSYATAERIVKDLPDGFIPNRILEIGASVGFNSLALASIYKNAEIHSVEPDEEAVHVATSMAQDAAANYEPICGVGEDLKYPDNYFDLIICHTVIEHVQNVPEVIKEISRVLSSDGFVHFEAPNYIWPYEPHLGVWCIPVLGKKSVRFLSRLQGKQKDNWYVGHLQFVTPFRLEHLFAENSLNWVNRAEKKLLDAASGIANIKKYKFASSVLALFGRLGISKLLVIGFVRLGLYPSVMYTIYKSKMYTK